MYIKTALERYSKVFQTVVPASCLTHKHSFSWSRSLFFPTSASCGEGKHTARTRKVKPLFKATEIKL